MTQQRRHIFVIILISLFISHLTVNASELNPSAMIETRAIWVTRWDFSSSDDIQTIMRNAAAQRFNVVFFQVRGAGSVYFKSRYEPSAINTISAWDPLKDAIKFAHAYHLQLHAWVNVYPGWAGKTPPTNPSQLWRVHPDWFMMDSQHQRMALNKHYVWLSPTNSKVRLHLARLFCELIQNYDIDGIHLDYLRYPGPGYSYDSLSVARFSPLTQQAGPQIHEQWNQFRRDGITELVVAINWFIQRRKPDVIFSSAVARNRDIGQRLYLQDAHHWLARGAMDFVAPMIYTTNSMLFENMVNEHLRHSHARYIFPGINISDGPTIEAQINYCRQHNIPGHCLFSYQQLFPGHQPNGIMAYLHKTVYTDIAIPATYKWKKHHTPRPFVTDIQSLPTEVCEGEPFNVRCTLENYPAKIQLFAYWSDNPDTFSSSMRRPMTRRNGSSNHLITSYAIPGAAKGKMIYIKVATEDKSVESDIKQLQVQGLRNDFQQQRIIGPILQNAQYAAMDPQLRTWVCEQEKRQIRVLQQDGQEAEFSPIHNGRNPQGSMESLSKPCGIAIDAQGIVYVTANSGRNAIYRYDSNNGYALPAVQLDFWPGEIDVDRAGHVFVIESDGNAWHVLAKDGTELRHSPHFGSHLSQGIAVSRDGSRVYVACRAEGTVHCWHGSITGDQADYEQVDDLPVKEVGLGAVDTDSADRIYVSQGDVGHVSVFDSEHQFIEYIRGSDPPLTGPRGVAISPDCQYLTIVEWGIESSMPMQRFIRK